MADFIEKLKAILMGGGGGQPAPDDLNPDRPWESPAAVGAHMMPGGQMMRNADMPMNSIPLGGPQQPADEAMQLAAKIAQQKRMAAMMAPEGAWNK